MEKSTYAFGHDDAALRSYSARTAQNSAAYLLKYLKPDMHILDVGCGPGTITTSFAQLVPQGHVTGVDSVPADADVLERARKYAATQGVTNITFAHGNISDLSGIQDGMFDVVHCHQVLQHVADPVRALKEMRRVAKPGTGLVAAREADAGSFTWYPKTSTMDEWMRVYWGVATASGAHPDGGRHLVAWALTAGFERGAIDATAGTWCFSTPEERAWFGGMWADLMVDGALGTRAMQEGVVDREGLEKISEHWRVWIDQEDGWFALLHGEIVCRA